MNSIEQAVQELGAVTSLAAAQLAFLKESQSQGVEILVGRNADGENAPKGSEAVDFSSPTSTGQKLVLVGGVIKNYDVVTTNKDVYFVMVTFENCGKLPAKARMIACKTSV